ncbi:hypothetical protein GCM10009623_02000 [Nocardioides aestuarii]|uniref:WD40 repeat domain-containing protein n=1 Tax=Nocardioides aestuarii TaxID=252231 RepID=A0ABW4TGU5_9ACTN
MTEKLQTLMREQADAVDFAAPDLDTMIAAGDRRVRHRRLGAAGGIAAVAAGVVLVAPFLTSDQRAVEPTGPTGAAPISWVDGTTLHEGARTTDLEFRPRAYVRTAGGYVLADGKGAVWSWQDGDRTLVGSTDARDLRLVSDEESGLAGWVSRDGSEYVVMDQLAGTITGYDAPAGTQPGDFAALDAGRAYWSGENGPVVVDLESLAETPVHGGRGTYLGDLEDDLVAVSGDQGVVIETLDGTTVLEPTNSYADLGYLSPDAHYYTWDADELQVYDVRSGERVSVDVGGRGFATGFDWLGTGTLAVLAAADADDSSVAELLVCEVPAGSCRQVAELGPFDSLTDSLVLPVGIPIDG